MQSPKLVVGVIASIATWGAVAAVWPKTASAATCTWQSTSSSSWTTAANWSCGAVPTAADDAVFPAGATLQNSIVNDAIGNAVSSIMVTGGAYTFTGANTLYVGSAITSSSSFGPSFQIPIQANGDLTITANALGGIAFQGPTIAMLAHALTIAGGFGTDILSAISGTGQITKNGAGLVLLAGSNTFTGPMAVTAGIARLQNALALGPTNGATTVSGTGQIQIQGSIVLVEPLIVNGGATPTLNSMAGTNKWNGPITLTSDASVTSSAAALTIGGQVTGAGKLTVTGNGLILSGANNTFAGGVLLPSVTQVVAQSPTTLGTGLVTVTSGASVRLEATGTYGNAFNLAGTGAGADGALTAAAANTVVSGPIAVASDTTIEIESGGLTTTAAISGAGGLTKTGAAMLTINAASTYAGTTSVSAGTLKLGAAAVLPTTTSLTVASLSTLDLAGHDQVVSSVTGAGNITLGAGTLTFGDATNATFSGAIQGTGGLVLQGAGTKTFTGSSSFAGPTTITQGTVHLQGAVWSASNVLLQGGTLGLSALGGSTQSMIATGGTLASGFTPTRNGTSGNVGLNAASTFAAEVTSATPGQYSRLTTTGTVSLGGATLALASTAAPVIGSSYTLVDNDGTDAIVGTFATLPEGAAFDAAGGRFTITYAGGTGNDVVVDAVMPLDAGSDAGNANDSGPTNDAGNAGDAGDAGNVGDGAIATDGGANDGAAPDDASVPGDGAAHDDASPNSATADGGGCAIEGRTQGTGAGLSVLGIALLGMIRRRRSSQTVARRR